MKSFSSAKLVGAGNSKRLSETFSFDYIINPSYAMVGTVEPSTNSGDLHLPTTKVLRARVPES